MQGFEHTLLLLLILAALSVVGRRFPWPMPITYVAGGAFAVLIPGMPEIDLDPGFFFLCFVPPLLFADGWQMPLRDFLAAKRPILTLATGLVVFTTLAVGLTAHALVPELPLPMAFALGAVVSPTDAVAVGAITSRLKVPSRLTAILNGESLMNDATGLVAFKFALAAMLAGSFSLTSAALNFLLVALGGLAVGLAIAWAVGWLRDTLRCFQSTDTYVELTVSLMTPFAAYLAAGALGLSNILAVVAAGLYSGWRDPIRMDVATRQAAWSVWSTVIFWLNGLAFVLLGLQAAEIVEAVRDEYSHAELITLAAIISGVAILARLAWVFPGAYLPYLFSSKQERAREMPSPGGVLVTGWAGMRGTITLAAALSLPLTLDNGEPLPGRDMVVFLATAVTLVTLVFQGMTLEALIRRVKLKADDTLAREERLARVTAVEAGLSHLRATQEAGSPEEMAALGEVRAEYEHRLAELTSEGETQASARRRRSSGHRHRLAALRAERKALDDLWRRDVITDDTHRPLQQLLDHEEAMLTGQTGAGAHG